MSKALKDLLGRLFAIVGAVTFTLIAISLWLRLPLIDVFQSAGIGLVFVGMMVFGNHVRFLREARVEKAEING